MRWLTGPGLFFGAVFHSSESVVDVAHHIIEPLQGIEDIKQPEGIEQHKQDDDRRVDRLVHEDVFHDILF